MPVVSVESVCKKALDVCFKHGKFILFRLALLGRQLWRSIFFRMRQRYVRFELKHTMKNLPIVLITLLFSFFGISCGSKQKSEALSVDELHKDFSRTDIVVLDVRTPEELLGELGKLDGVVNIPVQDLEKRIGELRAYKDKQIYVICRSGHRSKAAVKILANQGLKAVSVDGGMRAWRNAFGNANK